MAAPDYTLAFTTAQLEEILAAPRAESTRTLTAWSALGRRVSKRRIADTHATNPAGSTRTLARAAGVPEDASDTGDTGDDDASPLADAAEPPGQPDPAAGAAEQLPEPAELPAPTAPAEQDAQPGQDAPAGIEASPLDDSPTKGRPAPRRETFVAEVWIDPDWYDVQSSPDAMPSVGLPETVKLSASNLIGRESRSRGIVPEVDCGVDTGCSRRQAMLTTDGRRWYVEDLASANGTYVGPAAGPLPTEPIVGRKELGPDDRSDVGAWTRIVVRKASREEIDALG